jgi:mono/diheme cytochrome c family protein
MVRKAIVLVSVLAALLLSAVSLAARDAAPGNTKVGKKLFLQAGIFCGSCHTLKAAGSTGRDGPNLDQANLSYAKIVDAITKGSPASKHWPTGMPRYGGTHAILPPKFLKDVAAFVYVSSHH